MRQAEQQVEPHPGGSLPTTDGRPSSAPEVAPPERPLVAPDVRLIGEFDGPGFRDRQWLVMKGARFLQLTEILYRTLERADGTRGLGEIASDVGLAVDRVVSRANVEHLIRTRLAPMGLIVGADGSTASRPPDDGLLRSPLQINLRVKVAGRRIEPIARALTFLHTRAAMFPLLAAVVLVHGWLYGIHGVIGPLKHLVAHPDVMLVVLPMMLVASVFHEFGHASALVHEGGRVRSMGAGFVLVFPALYTDVTDGYRLSRGARVRIDLAGPYFHLLFGLVLAGLYLLTGAPHWLILIILTDVEVGRQFLPIGRLDGYWAMADLSGIPDFFSRLVPFVASVLPIPVPEGMRAPELTRRAKRVFVAYGVALCVGFPAFLAYVLSHLPELAAAGWHAFSSQLVVFETAFRAGATTTWLASGLQMLFLVLEAVGAGLFLYLITWRPGKKVWAWSSTRPAFFRRTTRGALLVLAGALAAIFGAVYPWRIFQVSGLGLARAFTGTDSVAGRAVLIGGICAVCAAGAMIVSWSLPWRRIAAWIALGLGLAGTAMVATELVTAGGLTEGWLTSTIHESTGRAPTPSEFQVVRQQMSDLGLSVTPGYGLWVTGVGSLLASIGGAVAVASRAPGRDPLVAPAPVELGVRSSPTGISRRRRPQVLATCVALVAAGSALAFIAFGIPTRVPSPPAPAADGRPEQGLALWPPDSSDLRDRLGGLGLPVLREEALAFHTHQHLEVFVHGMEVRVPEGIGIDHEQGILTVLHTHGSDGVIHVEAPRREAFTLGQFFDVWGVRLTPRCLGGYCGDGGDEAVRVFVNGTSVPGSPAKIELRDHDQIVVAFGTREELPTIRSSYRFDQGL